MGQHANPFPAGVEIFAEKMTLPGSLRPAGRLKRSNDIIPAI
jgi:hypothetical protein